MNAILSLILSFVLAFGGGAMPAVPETAVTYTVDNIVLTVQDETIALNPALMLSTAAGSQQVQAQFGVQLGEDTLMPVAGELTADDVKFTLGESRAYTLDAATLNELTGIIEPDEQGLAALQEFSEFAALMPAVMEEAYNMEANWALSEKMLADWIERSGATPETMEVEVNGVTIPATAVQLDITANEIVSSLDMVRTEGSETMQAYMQQLLDIMNLVYGSSFESYAELVSVLAEFEDDDLSVSYPMELTYGQKDGLYYSEALANTEIDGVATNVSAVSFHENGVTEMSMSMSMEEEDLSMNMGGTFAYDLDGNLSVNYEIAGSGSEDEPLEMNAFVSLNTAVGEDGLKTSSFGMDLLASAEETAAEYGYSSATEVNVSLGWNSAERFEEDGSVTADCEVNLYVVDGEEVIPVTLTFSLNRSEAAFADAFEGLELVQLPADTEHEAYQLLSSEAFGLVADLMTLSMDESITEMIALFEAQTAVITTEAEVYPDKDIYTDDPAVLDEDYLLDDIYYEESYDYPEYTYSAYDGGEPDFAAAAEIFGSELMIPAAPEGYRIEWMYVSPEYCSVDFTSDMFYMSLSMSPVYDYTSHTMVVGEDGSLTALETPTAQVQMNEDGSLLYIDIIRNGFTYSLYVDGVPAADVQAMIAGIMG